MSLFRWNCCSRTAKAKSFQPSSNPAEAENIFFCVKRKSGGWYYFVFRFLKFRFFLSSNQEREWRKRILRISFSLLLFIAPLSVALFLICKMNRKYRSNHNNKKCYGRCDWSLRFKWWWIFPTARKYLDQQRLCGFPETLQRFDGWVLDIFYFIFEIPPTFFFSRTNHPPSGLLVHIYTCLPV